MGCRHHFKNNRELFKKTIILFLLVSAGFFILSCPSRIDESMLLHVKDTIAPVISITAPADGSSYASAVIVEGVVKDQTAEDGSAGEVRSLSFEVSAAGIGEQIEVKDDGTFIFQFSTSGLSGFLNVKLKAEDWNGNVGEVSLNLVDEGAIPSFSVIQDDGKVRLEWEEVPLTEQYVLYYTCNGTLPSENNGSKIDDITSPYKMEGLDNSGCMYVFRLNALSENGDDNWSDYIQAIPLSPTVLFPSVTGSYNYIHVSWPDIPGCGETGYEVYRSTSENSGYVNITGIIKDTSFFDGEAKKGQVYYYKVKPALKGCGRSFWNSGEKTVIPENLPELVTTVDTGDARAVTVQGSYAYVSDYDDGLVIVDISDPENAHIKGSIDTGSIIDAYISGNYAYAVGHNYDSTLYLINIENKKNPMVLDSLEMDLPISLTVVDDYAYVVETPSGTGYISVVDISTPGELPDTWDTVAANIDTPEDITDDGSYLYIADSGEEGLVIYNLTDPAAPGYEATAVTNANSCRVTLDGNYAFVASRNYGTKVVNISTPGTPLYNSDNDISSQYALNISIRNKYAYIADDSDGIKVIDISDLTDTMITAVEDTVKARDIAFSGNYAFLADGPGGLKVFDITIPSLDSEADPVALGTAVSVTLAGDYAYIADGGSGDIVNIRNPSDPSHVGPLGTALSYDIAVIGDYAYVSTGTGLQIIDISEKDDPEVLNEIDIGDTRDLIIRGSLAFFSMRQQGIKIFDISTITDPVLLGALDTENAYDLAVEGDYLYVADNTDGLKIINISNPGMPVLKGSWQHVTSNGAAAVALQGDYAYLAEGWRGVRIIDISDPLDPQMAVEISVNDSAQDIDIAGNYAYVSDRNSGITVIDITNPLSPDIVDNYDTTQAMNSAVRGEYIYTADTGSGLRILDITSWD